MEQEGNPPLPVHLLTLGAFGRAVARYLGTLRSDVKETPVSDNTIPIPEMWPISRVTAITSWRPAPTLCKLLEELSYDWQRPFVPLFQSSTALRLGPVVVPGQGPCWTCWTQRFRQHAEWPEAEAVILDHYAQHGEAGPHGFLEPFAMMAAERLSSIIDQLSSSIPIAGNIWQIDMLTRDISVSRVVGVHDCSRCGLHRAAATRTVAPMRAELEYLWSKDSKGRQ
jgi:bacteriocin biosynthesis cyclodehydratase domain-containing protein